MPNDMSSVRRPTRRGAIVGTLGSLSVALISGLAVDILSPSPAVALSSEEATDLVLKVADAFENARDISDSDSALLQRFRTVLNTYADLPIIARSSLGVEWRSATTEQRRAYTNAFSRYMTRKYSRRLRSIIDGDIRIVRSRKVRSGVLVESVFAQKGKSPMTVDWQISDKSGAAKIFNLYIEGVSLLSIERGEIGAMLDESGGDLDRLIATLDSPG